MKKQVKVISIVLMVVMLLCSIANVALATTAPDLSTKITEVGKGNTNANTTGIVNLGQMVVTIIQTAGIVIAIVVLLVLGIKYMMGSAEEKAEYKKVMIPYVIGAVLIFASTTIVNVVYKAANSAASVTV